MDSAHSQRYNNTTEHPRQGLTLRPVAGTWTQAPKPQLSSELAALWHGCYLNKINCIVNLTVHACLHHSWGTNRRGTTTLPVFRYGWWLLWYMNTSTPVATIPPTVQFALPTLWHKHPRYRHTVHLEVLAHYPPCGTSTLGKTTSTLPILRY